MNRHQRRARPLKRTVAQRPELRTIMVFCEGRNSEPDYINGLKKLTHIAAESLDKRHARNDTRFPHDNPSSGMYKLLRSLES